MGVSSPWILKIEKRKAHYSLAAIKTTFALPAKLNRTFSAVHGAETLGMDDADVIAVLQGLTNADFHKSMTSYVEVTIWQDVYKPIKDGKRLYVKFTLNAQRDLILISFKEA